jgi:hypothetical protein
MFLHVFESETLMGRAKAAMRGHDYNLNWAKNLLDNLTWAKRLLASTHAIDECEKHGYFTDNFDKEAVEDAVKLAAANPPRGLSPDEAAKVVRQAIQIIGVECPGCASKDRE